MRLAARFNRRCGQYLGQMEKIAASGWAISFTSFALTAVFIQANGLTVH